MQTAASFSYVFRTKVGHKIQPEKAKMMLVYLLKIR